MRRPRVRAPGHWVGVLLVVAASWPAALLAATSPVAGSPTIALSESPASGPSPLSVQFIAQLSPSTTSATFNWSFGDGGTFQETATGISHPVHQYVVSGRFLAQVTALTAAGPLSAHVLATVAPALLKAYIEGASPDAGPAPLTVDFLGVGYGGTGTYATASWQFGDGGNGSGFELNYTYARPGTYQVNLTIRDSGGNASLAVGSVYVDPSPPLPAPGFSLTPPEWLVVGAFVAALLATIGWAWAGSRRVGASPSGHVPAGALREPPPAGGGGAASDPSRRRGMPPPDTRQAYERILTQLFFAGPHPPGVGRADSTREGLARGLQIDPSTVTRALGRLADAGAVSSSLEHVPGAARRVRCYSLTPRGQLAARSLRRASTLGPGESGTATAGPATAATPDPPKG